MTAPLSYDLPGAAAATGLSVTHFNEAIRAGRIKAKTVKARGADDLRQGKRIIMAADLEAYLEELPRAE